MPPTATTYAIHRLSRGYSGTRILLLENPSYTEALEIGVCHGQESQCPKLYCL